MLFESPFKHELFAGIHIHRFQSQRPLTLHCPFSLCASASLRDNNLFRPVPGRERMNLAQSHKATKGGQGEARCRLFWRDAVLCVRFAGWRFGTSAPRPASCVVRGPRYLPCSVTEACDPPVLREYIPAVSSGRSRMDLAQSREGPRKARCPLSGGTQSSASGRGHRCSRPPSRRQGHLAEGGRRRREPWRRGYDLTAGFLCLSISSAACFMTTELASSPPSMRAISATRLGSSSTVTDAVVRPAVRALLT